MTFSHEHTTLECLSSSLTLYFLFYFFFFMSLYVTSSFFSRRLFCCIPAHTPHLRRGWPAPITEYRITQVAALYDRLFFIIFFTHTTEILFMNSMFELSDECPLVCRSTLQCRLSDYVMFWTIPPLGR